ncbi:MAG: amine oxidase [Chloroflexi bacterium HGW-Chloroflexi-8]|nr:MAG: amine oxidase [Chloroflexi bacterium HGW-Chloroflexi-8]
MNQKELREQENRCIQEQAPACSAACPVHVDVRGMTAAIAKGNFDDAQELYRKSIPFPQIISRICDQPCQKTCLRKDLGGAIEIAALERACLDFAGRDFPAVKQLARKSKTVAIVGAGISGLTAAYDLARKGWGVVLFEASGQIGGGLWQTAPDLLPRDVLIDDLKIIEQMGIEIHLNSPIGRTGGNGHGTLLARMSHEFSAIYLCAGPVASDFHDLKLDGNGYVTIDPVTFQTSIENVFAGGDILRFSTFANNENLHHSAILSLSEGRRAAISIDRYLQTVSLSASRFFEGQYTTTLFTNTKKITPQPPRLQTDLSTCYRPDEAVAEADRCIQCECMECVHVCAYLEHYQAYPKRYIREIYNNLSIVMGTRHSNQFINTCALCGLCAEVCPTNLDMGQICKGARIEMVKQQRMPASAHDFALRDMAFSNGEKFSLTKNPPGTNVSTYVFFPGCQLSASYPHYVEKAYSFLKESLPEEKVGLMLRCCGAPADWAGQEALFAESNQQFLTEYEKMGNPKLILACSSCYQIYKKHFPQIEITSFWEIYDQFGPQTERRITETPPLALHDPCSTRYESKIQDSVRNILRKNGIEIEELPLNREKTECCSYGGLMWLANKQVAEKMIQGRVNQSQSDYLTYCAMCRDFFSKNGKRSLHLFDLLFGKLETDYALTIAPDFSRRHENRARLKEKFLKEQWSESMPETQDFEKIHLILTDSVKSQIENRFILEEDIQKVIANAEKSGKRMFNQTTNHYLAYFKPASVTYWVEYSPQENGAFEIHKAYSHRMEIGRGAVK